MNDAGPLVSVLRAPDARLPLSVAVLGRPGEERAGLSARMVASLTGGSGADPGANPGAVSVRPVAFRPRVGEGAAAGERLLALVQGACAPNGPAEGRGGRAAWSFGRDDARFAADRAEASLAAAARERRDAESRLAAVANADGVSLEALLREDGGGATSFAPALESARFLGITDALDSLKDLVARVQELRDSVGRWRAWLLVAIRTTVERGVAKLFGVLAAAIVVLLAVQWGHDALLGEHTGYFADIASFLTQVALLVGAAWVWLRRLTKSFTAHVDQLEGLHADALTALANRRQRFSAEERRTRELLPVLEAREAIARQRLGEIRPPVEVPASAAALLAPDLRRPPAAFGGAAPAGPPDAGQPEAAQAAGAPERVVVCVDGLDFCDAPTTLAVLGATRELLDDGAPVALFVTADPAGLRRAILAERPLPSIRDGAPPAASDPREDDRLEGLFHVTVHVGPLEEGARRAALAGVLGAGEDPAAAGAPLGVHRPLTEEERSHLDRLAPLVPAAHAMRRWLTTYEVLRAGLSDEAFAAFLGEAGRPGSFREAAFLLAVGCGRPSAAPSLFAALATGGGGPFDPRRWAGTLRPEGVAPGEGPLAAALERALTSLATPLDPDRLRAHGAWAERHTTGWRSA